MLRNLNKISKAIKVNSLGLPQVSCAFHSSKGLQKPDNFLNGSNSVYLEQMYDNWVKDKSSVHPSWDAYFSNVTNGMSGDQAFTLPPTLGGSQTISLGAQAGRGVATGGDVQKQITESAKLFVLIKAFQRRGHELADLDPLSIACFLADVIISF